jgi:AraC-like DNA-binding protein
MPRCVRDEGIAPAVRAIHQHPERAWTVGELARVSAMSRSAFASRFRAVTGDSPIRYLARYRLATAARQLRTTNLPINEIARSVGYESIFSFSRAFKRAFGLPPRAYRDGGNPDDENDESPSLFRSATVRGSTVRVRQRASGFLLRRRGRQAST